MCLSKQRRVEAKEAAKHPTIHRMVQITKTNLFSNVNNEGRETMVNTVDLRRNNNLKPKSSLGDFVNMMELSI